MAYSPKDLTDEIRRVIIERADAGEIISRGWLVTEVLHKHSLKRLDEFSICCRQIAVSTKVDSALAQLKRDDEGEGDPDQEELGLPRMPGYRHLRKIYPIVRAGVIRLVPLDKLTDAEIDAKADSYDASSRARAAHADELRRYKNSRDIAA